MLITESLRWVIRAIREGTIDEYTADTNEQAQYWLTEMTASRLALDESVVPKQLNSIVGAVSQIFQFHLNTHFLVAYRNALASGMLEYAQLLRYICTHSSGLCYYRVICHHLERPNASWDVRLYCGSPHWDIVTI